MSKTLDQIKTIFELFSEAVLILDGDFKVIWKNRTASSRLPVSLNSVKAPKNLTGGKIDKVTIPTVHGEESACMAPLRDLFILFIPDPFPKAKTDRTPAPNNPQKDLKNIPSAYIYTSKAMIETINLSTRAASVDTNILITGETGIGKTFLAKLIHTNSPRKDGPFVSINCGAIPPTLLESELFGYEKGAFTGADRTGRVGLLETGVLGTVFLDEIAELSINLQVKLLNAIEEKKITRIGGRKPVELDIRIIAATNKDLTKMVSEGNLREDLFYRLNVISLVIPPLRSRPEDILPLANHFLEKYNLKYNVHKTFNPDVIQAFIQYGWPGNIRELQNAIERMMVMSEKEKITVQDLPPHILAPRAVLTPPPPSNKESNLQNERETLERELILKSLRENKSIRGAARKLGISHATLLRKIDKLNLNGAILASSKGRGGKRE